MMGGWAYEQSTEEPPHYVVVGEGKVDGEPLENSQGATSGAPQLYAVSINLREGTDYVVGLPRALIKRAGERTWEQLAADSGLDYLRTLLARHARQNGACKAILGLDELTKMDVHMLASEEVARGGEDSPSNGYNPGGSAPASGGADAEDQYLIGGPQPARTAPAPAGAVVHAYEPVALQMGGHRATDVPVRPPSDLPHGRKVVAEAMASVQNAIGASHGNRKELARHTEMSTLYVKLLNLEESAPLGALALAEGVKAQCDHQLRTKTADAVATAANAKALRMLDHLERARKSAARQGGILDFEHAAAWIAEEWAVFVEHTADRLGDHNARPPLDGGRNAGRTGPPGGDRYRHPNDRRP